MPPQCGGAPGAAWGGGGATPGCCCGIMVAAADGERNLGETMEVWTRKETVEVVCSLGLRRLCACGARVDIFASTGGGTAGRDGKSLEAFGTVSRSGHISFS